jgi:uncharacterized DUF497 family protein
MALFEWDEAKNLSNQRKHHLNFEAAALVFNDPFALMLQDRIENGEERWQTIGRVGYTLVVLVAHTVRFEEHREVIRIISARKADRSERKRYEEQAH